MSLYFFPEYSNLVKIIFIFLLCMASEIEQLNINTHSLTISYGFVENISLKAQYNSYPSNTYMHNIY